MDANFNGQIRNDVPPMPVRPANAPQGNVNPQGLGPQKVNNFEDFSQQKKKLLDEKRLSNFRKYGLFSALYGLFYCLCMYKSVTGGISHTVFNIGSLIFLALVDRMANKETCYMPGNFLKEKNGKLGVRLFYMVSIILLSISQFLTASFALHFFTGTGIFVLTGCLFYRSYVDSEGKNPFRIVGAVFKMIFLPFINLFEPLLGFMLFMSSRKAPDEGTIKRKQQGWLIFYGIIIAVPVVAVIIALLASADLVFSTILSSIKIDFDITDQFFDILGFIFWFFAALIGIYSIFTTLSPSAPLFRAVPEQPSKKGNPLLMIPMELILTLVYLVFCGIQFIFLLGHAELPDNYTYAEYAHEGFYQLLFVCLINILIATIVRSCFEKHGFLTALTMTICGCTYLMIFSSAFRMILYVQAYNLTFLRFFVLWFLAVLTVCLTILSVGLFNKNIPVAKFCLVAGTVLYMFFAFIKPDFWIAAYNVSNPVIYKGYSSEDGSIRYSYDNIYITEHLSVDSVPALIMAGETDTAVEVIKNNHDYVYELNYKSVFNKVRNFNVSDFMADQLCSDYMDR
ncbi:protein of unknown function [Lachnospiraceae bacterium]|nr:protein of unknown function [Lachnospiraceae bacterium]